MSRSKNFIYSPADTIRRIRENLREGRYSQAEGIFGIIKELAQNAEDAEARQLQLAWTLNLPNATHPLLQGPGLLAINDGKFKAEDGRAIRRFGLNSKAADAASIGKFGLGLKSVFHLAEVFFFTAVDERDQVLDADILNPWSDEVGGLHRDWDDWSTADQDLMRSFVRSFTTEGPRFCLWVPLRRRDQLGQVGPIMPIFPGEIDVDSLFAQDLPERLARLLPMLRHLRDISIWIALPEATRRHFSVTVDDGSVRRIDMEELDNLEENSPRSFAGEAVVRDAASDLSVIFSGREQRRSDPELRSLEQAEFWPQDIAMDEKSGEDRHIREKACPHAAVCFVATRNPSVNPRLAIHWSMFLPLSEPEVIPLEESNCCIDVFLHGYFFVDAGRNQIEGINAESPGSAQDSSGLRRAWNQLLARRGTLPLLPLAMVDITNKAGWDGDKVACLTRQLATSSLFRKFASDICRDWIWVKRLSPDGTMRWEVASGSLPFYVLPDTSAAQPLACVVFPGLRQLAVRALIAFRDAPRLASARPARWPADFVEELVSVRK